MTTPRHRLDIQGLRALAVLLVVGYHLWPTRVAGGYVGVDVFFVISGFLISARLISEAEVRGTVSLSDFWARRIRRLLPAAFIVLAVSLASTYLLLPRSLVNRSLREIMASTAYVLNWSLGLDAVDYQAADNHATLVQHFWTLSVEEQFYVLWPALLAVGLWVAHRRLRMPHSAASARRLAVGVLTATAAVSFAYSVFDTAVHGASAYFSTASRLWEFAIGGLLVFAFRDLRQHSLASRVSQPAARIAGGWLGVALIVASAFAFESTTPFPGALAAVPVVGAALVILTGRTADRFGVGSVLSTSPAPWIGDLSYSIYLWHWPLIILYPYATGHAPGFRGGLAILAATIVLAAATKYGIEDPLRFSWPLLATTRRAFVFMLVGATTIIVAAVIGLAVLARQSAQARAALQETGQQARDCYGAGAMDPRHDCPDPFAVPATLDTAHAALDFAWNFEPTASGCATRRGLNNICHYASGSESEDALSVVLVGDSHADHLIPPLHIAGEAAGWRTEFFTGSGCPALFLDPEGDLPLEYAGAADQPGVAECHLWSREVVDALVERVDIDVVIFSFTRAYPLDPANLVHQFDRIRDSGKVVLLARDLPGMEPDVFAPECIDTSDTQRDPCVWTPTDEAAPMFKAWQQGDGRFGYIDLWNSFCSEGGCHAVIGGVVVYFDDEHLTLTYAKTLAPYLREAVDDALAVDGVGRG